MWGVRFRVQGSGFEVYNYGWDLGYHEGGKIAKGRKGTPCVGSHHYVHTAHRHVLVFALPGFRVGVGCRV